jgi:hypothetical protein
VLYVLVVVVAAAELTALMLDGVVEEADYLIPII